VLDRSFKHSSGGWAMPLMALCGAGVVLLLLGLAEDPGELLPATGGLELSEFVWVQKPGAWLGVDLQPPGRTAQGGIATGSGATVTRVLRNSPAQAAGLRAGDVILSANQRTIDKPADLTELVASHKSGDEIALVFERGGVQQATRVTLGQTPVATLAAARQPLATASAGQPWLGLDVQDIDQLMQTQLGLPDRTGVLVSDVSPGSPAEMVGLARGDVIRAVGRNPIHDGAQLQQILETTRPGRSLDLTVWHRGTLQQIAVVVGSKPAVKTKHAPLPGVEVEVEAAWLGMTIVPLTRAEAEELGIDGNLGGVVVDTIGAGAGADAGFQIGDVIIAVNGTATPDIASFEKAADEAIGALADVIRFGRHLYVSVPPPDVAIDLKHKDPVQRVFFGW